MITAERLRTFLYWTLLAQCCVISVSIAAASLLLACSIISFVYLLTVEKRWFSLRSSLDAAFLAYIAVEIITAINSVDQAEAFINSKRLLLIAIVYGTAVSFDGRKKIFLALNILVGTIAALSIFEVMVFIVGGHDRLFVFQHYMTTGGLKMIACLIVVPFIVSPDGDKKTRIFFSISVVPILTALMLTNTRSAWLGFIAGILLISILYYRSLLAFLSIMIISFFLFAPSSQIDRAQSIVDLSHPNNVGRVTMWTTGLQMWKDKPLLGFGDIDLYESYSQYRTPEIGEPAGHLHNNYIHLLVTLGAVGFLVVMSLFALIAGIEYTIFRKFRNDPTIRNIALGSLAVFSGFLVNGLFEWNFGDHEIMVFVWFSVGLVFASERNTMVNA